MKNLLCQLSLVLFIDMFILTSTEAKGPYDKLRLELRQRYGNIPEVDQFIKLANKHWKLIRKWHIKMRRSLWPSMPEDNRKALGLIEDDSKPEHLSLHHPFVEDWFTGHLGLPSKKQGPHFGKLVMLLDTKK